MFTESQIMYNHVHMATKTVLSAFSARYSLGGECAGNVMFFGGAVYHNIIP